MRGLLPFDGFFGDTALDHFFSDAPAAYKDYVSVPKVDIEDKKDFYELPVICLGLPRIRSVFLMKTEFCPCPLRKRNRRRKKMMTVITSAVNVPALSSAASSM